MKSKKRMMLIILCSLIMAGMLTSAAGAVERKKLFNICVTDVNQTQVIPIYEITDGKKLTIGQKKSTPVMINIGTGTAAVSIKNKTQYYKSKYSKMRYLQKLSLTGNTGLKTFYVITKDGKERAFKLAFKKMPNAVIASLTTDKSTIAMTKDKITIEGDITSYCPVTAELKIVNAAGKTVFYIKKELAAGSDFAYKWNGRPSKGNAAGLKTTACAPAGTYTIGLYVSSPYGNVKKKVKAKETMTIVTSAEEAYAANNPWESVNWGWTMYVSGNETMDYVAEVICREVLKPNMTQVERAKALYNWIADHFSYHRGLPEGYLASYPAKIDVRSKKAQKNIKQFAGCITKLLTSGKAKKVTLNSYLEQAPMYWVPWGTNGMIHQVGDCCINATVYNILLRHAGIESDLLEHGVQGGGSHHFFNIVRIGSKYYMADVDIAVEGGGNKMGYAYFLRGTAFAQTQGLYASAALNSRAINSKLYAKMTSGDCPGR